jgi:hypothetical protein
MIRPGLPALLALLLSAADLAATSLIEDARAISDSEARRELAHEMAPPSVAEHKPSPAEILARRGDAALAGRHLAAALAFYNQAVAAAPQDIDYRRRAARVADYLENDAEAAALLAPILATSPGAALEWRAMTAQRAGRFSEAARDYAELRRSEPDNAAAGYGLAGALRGAGKQRASAAVYREIVRATPGESYAVGALREIEDGLRGDARGDYAFLDEDSPGRLADISRNLFRAAYDFQLGDALRLALGPDAWIERPEEISRPYFAAGATARADWRVASAWRLSLDYTFKGYSTRSLRDTNTGGAALAFQPWSALTLATSYRREDVLHNRYNFSQATQADVARISGRADATRWLELSADAALWRYTDDNLQLDAGATAGFVLARKPGKLVAELRGRYLTTQWQSESVFTSGEETNVIHPYWTPRDYFRGTVALLWEQSLSLDAAIGQNEFSYHAGVQTSLDTDANPSVGFGAGLRWDIVRNLLLDVSGTIERSPEWNGASAAASLAYGF